MRKNDPLISTKDCAERLGISTQAVSDACKEGRIKYADRVGGRYLIRQSVCDAYQVHRTPQERGKKGGRPKGSGKKAEEGP